MSDRLAYWRDNFCHEQPQYMAVYPYIREAGRLIFLASQLWVGRFGFSREREKAMKKIAYTLGSSAKDWSGTSYIWSDMNNLESREAGSVLGNYQNIYLESSEESFSKSSEAARYLVWSTALLTNRHIKTCHDVGLANINAIEDALEQLGEMPCAEPLNYPISEQALQALERYAAYEAAIELTQTALQTITMARPRHESELKTEADRWSLAHGELVDCRQPAWQSFVDQADAKMPQDTRSVLLNSNQGQKFYCDYNRHYKYPNVIRQALYVARTMIVGILQSADIACTVNESDQSSPVILLNPAEPHGVKIPDWIIAGS